MKVGIDLETCIYDIFSGAVMEYEVQAIVSLTSYENKSRWESVMTIRANCEWIEDPEKYMEIAKRLFETGKIIQPRIGGHVPPEWNVPENPKGNGKDCRILFSWIDI